MSSAQDEDDVDESVVSQVSELPPVHPQPLSPPHTELATNQEPIVQYAVMQKSVAKDQQFNVGACMAQAAHACVSAVWAFRDHPETVAYCNHVEGDMRKVVLEVKDENALVSLAQKLKDKLGLESVLWREQPENVVTCLATRPTRRTAELKKLLSRAKCRMADSAVAFT
ncbi:hypothetical protein PPROV_000715900 [Pycnococcus provasolii]|uniref:peptidyl-tRNA hydrolase n=1 Tax=Pycnococcus provasolii TaxID=41880 RepID=A0A830HRN3_9CHLO|nr:hypothetical protein PPROV_000715900 [Pycnococcus provasolii]